MTDATASNPGPWNNGLLASSYVPLTDVSAPMAPRLLTALERARIAAYLAEAPEAGGSLRLYVAAAERADARTIVAAVVRANGGDDGGDHDSGDHSDIAHRDLGNDPLADIDTDAEFAALIADWHVDTLNAIREAERDLSREDEDWRQRLNQPPPQTSTEQELTWLDDDHFVPPTPPPIPRPTAPIVVGLLLVALSIVVLAFGGELGLSFEASLFLAVCGILSATGMFVMRLRNHNDEDDDGAVV